MERIFGASSVMPGMTGVPNVTGVCSASSGKNQPAVEAVQDFSAAAQKETDASGGTAQIGRIEEAHKKDALRKAIRKSIMQVGMRMAQESAAKVRETFNA